MWEFFEPKNNQWYRWDLNGASAFLKKTNRIWQVIFNQIAFQNLQDTFGGPYPVEFPEGKDKAISFIMGEGEKAALRPYLSSVPYLVTVQDDIKIMPDAETHFDVLLPPLLRFEITPHEEPLAEQMPFILSRTWFGDSMSGTPCHSLPSPLLPRCDENILAEENANVQSLIHCKLLVRNTSKTVLDLKQAAIFTEMLNIYEKDAHLITDEVVLDSLNGGNLQMSIRHGQKKGCKKLSDSLCGGKSEVLVRRGVNFLKKMTSI